MNSLELIEKGIIEGDWDFVCRGYKLMTGKDLQPPQELDCDNSHECLDKIREILSQAFFRSDTTEVVPAAQILEKNGGVKTMAEQKEDSTKQSADMRNDMDKFRVEHGRFKPQPNDEGKVASVPLPHEPPKKKNEFVDDKTILPDLIDESQNLSLKKKPEPRRPEVKKMKVVCSRCSKPEMVDPLFAPKSFGSEDIGSNYICNTCVTKNKKS